MKEESKKLLQYKTPIIVFSILIVTTFCGSILFLFGITNRDMFYSKPTPDENFIIENDNELEITFITEEGREVSLIAEVADSPEERQRGLMFREFMNFDRGMIFVFNQPQELEFWMKNTLISLDIIFVNEDREIIKIHKNTEPENTTKRYKSETPALYAIEVNSGWTDFYSIQEGDKVTF